MTDSRRIMVNVPSPLLEQVDWLVAQENGNRSQWVREAIRVYADERRKQELRESLKWGYQEMAELNLSLAEEGFAKGERQLAECD